MTEEGICVGCGSECLESIECGCGREEVYACQDCMDSDMTLVCGVCRDRAGRLETLGPYACRDFQDDEAVPGRVVGGRLPMPEPVGV